MWYYVPKTLSEYKLQQLSLAYFRGFKKYFDSECEYSSVLLKSDHPQIFRGKSPYHFSIFYLN